MADLIREHGDFFNSSMQMHEQMHQPLTRNCTNGKASRVEQQADGTSRVVRKVAVSRMEQAAMQLCARGAVKNHGGQKGSTSEIRKRHRMAVENAPPAARRAILAPVNQPPAQLPFIPIPVCLVAPLAPPSA